MKICIYKNNFVLMSYLFAPCKEAFLFYSTYAMQDAQGNTEAVPAGLVSGLMQAGVVSKIPKTLEEFMATQPSFEEVNRRALEDALLEPGRRKLEEVRQQQGFHQEMQGHVNNAVIKMMDIHAAG